MIAVRCLFSVVFFVGSLSFAASQQETGVAQVAGLYNRCRLNETAFIPCASGLVCKHWGLGSFADYSAYRCVEAVRCVQQGGACNNFLDGRSRCCETNGTSLYCHNESGDGIAQTIGTCRKCGKSNVRCSRDSDCCIENKQFCKSDTCISCLRTGEQCIQGDRCCTTECERNICGGVSFRA